MIIALDGPAAAGKGTLAKRLAAHFGLPHLDTGALYRAVAARALRTGEAPEAVAAAFRITDMDAPDLRSGAVGAQASRVAAIPAVRASLLEFQRNFARQPQGAVLDGRDIGTVVCPWPETVKLFVTASPEARARRRYNELLGRGETPIYAAVFADLAERDKRDSERADAPMKPAPDADVLDTSALDPDEAFRTALGLISAKTRARG
ncbi:MAG: (d)CMP kinase [Rhodospirillales bacterium]|nr:(d)CMP kinase [Rhodospirillales bacterium]